MFNLAYIASDKLKDIKRGERAKDKPAKPSTSIIDLEVINLVRNGEVQRANAILNQRIKEGK